MTTSRKRSADNESPITVSQVCCYATTSVLWSLYPSLVSRTHSSPQLPLCAADEEPKSRPLRRKISSVEDLQMLSTRMLTGALELRSSGSGDSGALAAVKDRQVAS
jgi:hypothetical protein